MKGDFIIKYTNEGERMSSRFLQGLSLAETVGAAHLKLPKHSHRLAGFSLILQGGYQESYGKTVLDCAPSSVKFHPAGESHADFYGNKTVRNFIIEFEPHWLTRMGGTAFVGSDPALFGTPSVLQLMMKLRAEFHSADDETPFSIEGLAIQLIAETSRLGKKPLPDDCPRWLAQAKELLDDQFLENLSLAFVAQEVGVHPVYLAHSFRQFYRCSVGEYLRQRRISYACHKICTSKDSLVEIALASGFSNQSHFARVFKQVTGMSPARYRSLR